MYLLCLSLDDDIVPPVVVEPDSGGADACVKATRPEVDRKRHTTIAHSQVQVIFNTVAGVEQEAFGSVGLKVGEEIKLNCVFQLSHFVSSFLLFY